MRRILILAVILTPLVAFNCLLGWWAADLGARAITNVDLVALTIGDAALCLAAIDWSEAIVRKWEAAK